MPEITEGGGNADRNKADSTRERQTADNKLTWDRVRGNSHRSREKKKPQRAVKDALVNKSAG